MPYTSETCIIADKYNEKQRSSCLKKLIKEYKRKDVMRCNSNKVVVKRTTLYLNYSRMRNSATEVHEGNKSIDT